jgi:PPOX class probable F420-dependent enzyme
MPSEADQQQARIIERLQGAEYAYLTTVRPDGRPHTVPVCFIWEDGSILLFSLPESVKIRNLRENPSVSLALDTFGQDEYYSVVVEGTAKVVEEPGLDMNYPAYAQKYTPLSQRMFGTDIPPESFMRQYSQAVRITPTRIRHDA